MKQQNQDIPIDLSYLCQTLQPLGIKQVLVFDELPSTNTYAKEQAKMGCSVPMLVIADGQTNGRGRFQRTFVSAKSAGIYASLLLIPPASADQIQFLTIAACLAVVDMIEQYYPLNPAIKWLNDVYINDKKVCGILCEGILEANHQEYQSMVVGIGINTHTTIDDIPLELQDAMTSLQLESGICISRTQLIETVMKQFFHYYRMIIARDMSFMKRYKELNFLIGRSVVIDNQTKIYHVLDIDDQARIIIQDEHGRITAKQSGEVSLRCMNHQ